MTDAVIEIDRMIADVLAGKPAQWPAKESAPDYEAIVIERVLYHGVAGLLNKSAMVAAGWPSAVIDAIYRQAIALGMWELRHQTVLVQLLKAFHDQSIHPLILKGTAIAYDLYAQPAARQRGDSDILIAAHDLDNARSVLRRLNFEQGLSMNDEDGPVSLQESWSLDAADGSHHTIDLHWSVMNSYALGNLFTYAESHPYARQLPRLSEYAQSFSLVDSLLFSCVHRAEHILAPYYMNEVAHAGNERLIWAYDIDLYAKAFHPSEWDKFCTLAHAKGISRICLDGLQYAVRNLGTQVPSAVVQTLMVDPVETKAWRYLTEQNKIKRVLMDIVATPGLKSKLRIIFRKFLPPAAYMRSKYQHLQHRSLLALYVIRLFEIIFPKKIAD